MVVLHIEFFEPPALRQKESKRSKEDLRLWIVDAEVHDSQNEGAVETLDETHVLLNDDLDALAAYMCR